MNPSAIPICCSLVLTAALSAGISHWWSVRQFAEVYERGIPVAPAPAVLPENNEPLPSATLARLSSKASGSPSTAQVVAANGSKGQNEFFEALVEKMNRVEAQNRDLLDQLAETNRDMMKLEFRVDTHSESFRPMPLEEGKKPFSSVNQGSSIDGNPGVLPPRAEPVQLPSYE